MKAGKFSCLTLCVMVLTPAILPGYAGEPKDPKEPVERAGSAYVVMTNLDESDAYYQAVTTLAQHRKATVMRFDPEKLDDVLADLTALKPRFVAVVVKPEVIDTNFIRRFLMMSTRLDDDPFCDFSYGYITGATAQDAVAFVQNIIKAEKDGLPKKFTDTFVCGGQCSVEKKPAYEWLAKAGYEMAMIALGYQQDREGLKKFIEEHFLKDLEGHGLIQMTGCGDPERIWLFADDRNCDETKHWPYDPKKVGQNPDGEMFWIDAAMARRLKLYPAVLTSGTCHCGSLKRVYVEGDIVSTFGKSNKVELYEMPPEKSLGLAYLASGVTAAILPVGPNHGWRTNVEVRRMFITGAPLGEMMKSCYDELALAYCGPIKPGLYDVKGGVEADPDVTAMMRGGAANRVLYGDPAFAPFPKLDVPYLKTTGPAKRDDGSCEVQCEILDNAAPDYVDQFDCEKEYGSRVFFALTLPGELASSGFVRVIPSAGNDAATLALLDEIRWAEETTAGGILLHIAALSSKDAYKDGLGAQVGQKILFRLEPAGNAKERCRVGSWLSPNAAKKPEHATRAIKDNLAPVEKALESPWGYEWKERKFKEILDFIQEFDEKFGEEYDAGKVKFEFADDAKEAAEMVVSLKLDGESLKSGLDRLCKELKLTYAVDKERGVVRFSKAK